MAKMMTYLLCSFGLLKWVAWRNMRIEMERVEKAAQSPEIAMLSWWKDKLPTIGSGASAVKLDGILQVWLLLLSKIPMLSVPSDVLFLDCCLCRFAYAAVKRMVREELR